MFECSRKRPEVVEHWLATGKDDVFASIRVDFLHDFVNRFLFVFIKIRIAPLASKVAISKPNKHVRYAAAESLTLYGVEDFNDVVHRFPVVRLDRRVCDGTALRLCGQHVHLTAVVVG